MESKQDHFYQQPYAQHEQPPADKRSPSMTTAAIILSTIAASTACCIYISFICGILGITFALLSKGGEHTMSHTSKTALSMSIFAIGLTVALTVGSFLLLLEEYGSIETFLKVYMNTIP